MCAEGITRVAITPSSRYAWSAGSLSKRSDWISFSPLATAFRNPPAEGAHTSLPLRWSTLPMMPGRKTMTSLSRAIANLAAGVRRYLGAGFGVGNLGEETIHQEQR